LSCALNEYEKLSPFSLPLLDRSPVVAMELPVHTKLMRSFVASPFLAKPVEHKQAQAMSQVVTLAVSMEMPTSPSLLLFELQVVKLPKTAAVVGRMGTNQLNVVISAVSYYRLM
jgi:hypothetical protein